MINRNRLIRYVKGYGIVVVVRPRRRQKRNKRERSHHLTLFLTGSGIIFQIRHVQRLTRQLHVCFPFKFKRLSPM